MLLRIAASRACACYVLCTYIVCYARIHLVISLAVAQSAFPGRSEDDRCGLSRFGLSCTCLFLV